MLAIVGPLDNDHAAVEFALDLDADLVKKRGNKRIARLERLEMLPDLHYGPRRIRLVGDMDRPNGHCWYPHELTSTAEAEASALVVVVIAVFMALPAMQGVKDCVSVAPVAVAVNWKTRLVAGPAIVIGPTASVPTAETEKPQMYVVLVPEAARVPTTAPVVPVALPRIAAPAGGTVVTGRGLEEVTLVQKVCPDTS